MGFTKSFAGVVVCRALLGLFEGGILGGVIVYLAFFYRRHQMLLRSGLFYCAAPLSGAFGGLLASGLSKIEVGDYRRWPWIFFSESSCSFPTSVRDGFAGKVLMVTSRGRGDGNVWDYMLLLHAQHPSHSKFSE